MSYQGRMGAAAAALNINQELDEVAADFELISRTEAAYWRTAERTFRCTLDQGDTAAGRALGKISMADWCRGIRERTGQKFSEGTGKVYKAIWEKYGRYPDSDRPSWTDAYTEIRGGTVGERMVEADFNRAILNATPEQKQKAFASLAREPEVIADHVTSAEVFTQIARDNPTAVETAWKDTQTNIALSEARWKAREEQIIQPAREARFTFEPTDTTLDRTSFFYDIQKKVDQWAHELTGIRDFLANAEDVNYVTRKATRSSFELLIRAAQQCRDVLDATDAEDDDVIETQPHKRPTKLRAG